MMTDQHWESFPFRSKFEQRLVFFLVFVGVLTLTYGLLFVVDFLPETPEAQPSVTLQTTDSRGDALTSDEMTTASSTTVPDAADSVSDDPYPVKITFDTLGGRSVRVLNPESRSVSALDTALLSGVVRHPDSADFDQVGTIFLFGHSSYLPNVVNKNFQAFNGIQKLAWGDTIRLESNTQVYVYRVDRVYEVSAEQADVKIETGKPKLTLVTCDSFGAKSDRFVVEASLIEQNPL